MVVKSAVYSKTFISQTKGGIEEDIFPIGITKLPQIINEEDEKIRKELSSRFGFDETNKQGGEGSDGKIIYSWKINDNVHSLKEDSKNAEYQTTVHVRKAGAENEVSFWSDLEKYLIANNFKELK
jgi:hypothetical protein